MRNLNEFQTKGIKFILISGGSRILTLAGIFDKWTPKDVRYGLLYMYRNVFKKVGLVFMMQTRENACKSFYIILL